MQLIVYCIELIILGTRALLNFIGVHPNVSTAGAEVHFFDKYYDLGFEWYRYAIVCFVIVYHSNSAP